MGNRALLGVLCLLAIWNIAACYSFNWRPSRCPYSCLRCSPPSSNRCVQCRFGFKLKYDKTCAVDTTNCAEHCLFCGRNGRNKCDKCEREYTLTLNKTCSKDAKCADHCAFCGIIGETKCDYCERGYVMSPEHTCVAAVAPCAEHCLTCQRSGKNKCDHCLSGYKLTENKTCISIYGKCAPNCLTCFLSGKDKCDICDVGYFMTGKDTCEREISPCAENCVTCQKNGQNKCDECYLPYTLTSNKTCARDENHCAAHCFYCTKNGKNKCDLCNKGYTLTLSKTCSSSAKCADHCHSCWRNGENKCDLCSNGYTLKVDKTCAKNVKCAEHCRSCRYSGESKCDFCHYGYVLNYYRTCIQTKDIPHPGKCPSVPSSAVGICHSECRHDAQCPNDKKCCSNGCGTSCKKPVPQTGPCADHCLSCKKNGQQKCDVCDHGYKLTQYMNCTSSPVCSEEIQICMKDWTTVYEQRDDPRSSQSRNTAKLCYLLPDVKDCMDDLRNVCDEDGTWVTSMELISAFEGTCAPTTVRIPPKTSPATSIAGSTPTKHLPTTTTTIVATSTERTTTKRSPTSTTTITSHAGTRSVIMVIRLKKEWKKQYNDSTHPETKQLVEELRKSLHVIYKHVHGFENIIVTDLFKSSVGVVHLVIFDHDLTDAERTTLALTLTSALAASNNKLQLGDDVVNVSGKPEMFVAGEKVEVSGACFLYDQKKLCQNGGSCVAREESPRCVCPSGYNGEYCDLSKNSMSTKGRNIVGPVVGGIGVFLVVGIVVMTVLVYRKKLAEKQDPLTPDGGVANPLYAVFNSGRSQPNPPVAGAMDDPVYSG
ncbi:hypothetical protein NP493_195g07031 [Ridgeia piscesae]|uniref:Uncharacterized protein n=1 Tax=Ridgeia piscesae TaxID=27915 RepID=A0AAD9P1U7_RIDPI|nr:hypothetical protein NP493_195g07031 [Ridgeia piscesae]